MCVNNILLANLFLLLFFLLLLLFSSAVAVAMAMIMKRLVCEEGLSHLQGGLKLVAEKGNH